jgi:hypothetical protein
MAQYDAQNISDEYNISQLKESARTPRTNLGRLQCLARRKKMKERVQALSLISHFVRKENEKICTALSSRRVCTLNTQHISCSDEQMV